jgi:hypothetical protein
MTCISYLPLALPQASLLSSYVTTFVPLSSALACEFATSFTGLPLDVSTIEWTEHVLESTWLAWWVNKEISL